MKRVILVRPEGPRNVGMALRICQNFGPCELALVAPQKPSMLVHPEFEQMSHGADPARAAIQIFDDLDAALADCGIVIGFTARVRGNRKRRNWQQIAPDYQAAGDAADERLALLFGSEVSGLTVEESNRAQVLAHVRTSDEHTSLNLAVSVAVVLSSLYTGKSAHSFEPGGRMLNGEGREFLKQRMKEIFAGKVALTESAAEDITESIERVFSRAPLENRDARAWHLMLRALGSETSPVELGLKPSEKGARRSDAMARKERRVAFEDGRANGTGESD